MAMKPFLECCSSLESESTDAAIHYDDILMIKRIEGKHYTVKLVTTVGELYLNWDESNELAYGIDIRVPGDEVETAIELMKEWYSEEIENSLGAKCYRDTLEAILFEGEAITVNGKITTY